MKQFSHLRPKDFQADPAAQFIQRDLWTRDVLGMMMVVVVSAAIVILGGTIGGLFLFEDTLPIYIVVALIAPSWWAARRGFWRLPGYVPVIACYGLGIYGSVGAGLSTSFVLFYVLASLLAGMLQGSRSRWAMVALSVITHFVLGLPASGYSFEEGIPQLIVLFCGLVGVSFLQSYFYNRLQSALTAQARVNDSLKAEIIHRQEVEALQRDQEARFRRMTETMSDLILEIDLNGVVQYSSPSHRLTMGLEPAEMLGTNAFALVHPDDLNLAREVFQRATTSRTPDRVQVRVRHGDGHYLPVEISGSLIVDDQQMPVGFVLSSRDITVQKEAERAIQESEEKFRSIIESLPLGIHLYSLDPAGELILMGYNPAANVILGFDHYTRLGKTLGEAFPGLDETEIPQRFREVAGEGRLWNSEKFPYRANGVEGIFEIHAFQTAPGKMAAVFEEVSVRIRAAEDLRQSEEKFATAFHTSPDSVNINRLADGVYLDINQGFTRLMGYTREEAIGKSSLALNIWADPTDRARLVKGLLERGVVENLQARFCRKNGEISIGLMSARVIMVNDEKCILSITRDITERQRAEIELREAHNELEQAYTATLEGWASALDLRERETAAHSRRVVDMTLRIARETGLEEKALVDIQRGALLHDIGKMGVPDSILLKPGKLTDEEWAIMRRHPDLAKSLLQSIDYLRPSIDIPYCHHERWDGAGYPRGIKAEEIPLEARIFAVVDVFDALTSDRPYRPAWTERDALRYLEEQKGKHFDPRIVDVFLHAFQSGLTGGLTD